MRTCCRLGCPIDLFVVGVVGVVFELDVDVDLLVVLTAVGHVRAVPVERRGETREQDRAVDDAPVLGLPHPCSL